MDKDALRNYESRIFKNPHLFKDMPVEYQTPTLCKFAIEQVPQLLKYIRRQTPTLCKIAIQQNQYALEYVRYQTYDICKLAVTLNGFAIRFVKNQTKKLCKLAIKEDPWSIKYIKDQTPELCNFAVKLHGPIIGSISDEYITTELCITAIKQNQNSIDYINKIKFPEAYDYWRLLYG